MAAFSGQIRDYKQGYLTWRPWIECQLASQWCWQQIRVRLGRWVTGFSGPCLTEQRKRFTKSSLLCWPGCRLRTDAKNWLRLSKVGAPGTGTKVDDCDVNAFSGSKSSEHRSTTSSPSFCCCCCCCSLPPGSFLCFIECELMVRSQIRSHDEHRKNEKQMKNRKHRNTSDLRCRRIPRPLATHGATLPKIFF